MVREGPQCEGKGGLPYTPKSSLEMVGQSQGKAHVTIGSVRWQGRHEAFCMIAYVNSIETVGCEKRDILVANGYISWRGRRRGRIVSKVDLVVSLLAMSMIPQ